MARWIGAVCCLLFLNTALAQKEPAVTPPQEFTSDIQFVPAGPEGNSPVPRYAPPVFDQTLPPPLPPGFDPTLQPPPLPPGYTPGQPVTMPVPIGAAQPQQWPPQAEPRLVTRVYGVADLVVGHEAAADPNQALLAMMAQQSDELAMQLASATAAAPGAQQNAVLIDLADTIESTFADEFEGRGSVTLHQATKSLIVRQTEEMHLEISDLLTQLRHVNDTEIRITLQLADLSEVSDRSEERMAFAMAHNGQVLDEAALQEFRELAQVEGTEQMTFSVTSRNGESASMPAYLLGSLTAVVSEDHSEVRVVLDQAWGMELGLSQQSSFRIPSGKSLLTVFMIEDSGVVMVLSAEIMGSTDAEGQVSAVPAGHDWQSRVIKLRNVSAESQADAIRQQLACRAEIATPEREWLIVFDPITNNISINASPRYFDEIVALVEQLDVAPTQIIDQVVLVEAESLPEDFVKGTLDVFDGTCEQFIEALRDENVELTVHSRSQMISLDGSRSEIQVGQVVPVINGVTFDNHRAIPTVNELSVGTRISLQTTVAANNCIEMQIEATHREIDESNVRPASGESITLPPFNCRRVRTTLSVPHTSTVVWPLRLAADEEADGSTMLVILSARVVTESPAVE